MKTEKIYALIKEHAVKNTITWQRGNEEFSKNGLDIYYEYSNCFDVEEKIFNDMQKEIEVSGSLEIYNIKVFKNEIETELEGFTIESTEL